MILLLLFVLIPVLLIEAYLYYDRYQSQRAHELQANLEMARSVANTFENFVKDVLNQELVLGRAITSSQPMTSDDITRLLTTRLGYAAIRELSWVSGEGIFLYSSNPSLIGANNSDRSYFRDIAAGREWTVGELIRSRVNGELIFSISRGIRDDQGALLGLVVAAIIPDKLDSVLSIERGKGGGFALVDNKGMMVYRYPAIHQTWEERYWVRDYHMVQEALEGKETAASVYAPFEGENRLVAGTPVSSIGWAATAGRTEAVALKEATSTLVANLVLFLAVALTAFGAALVFSRRISSSVRRLRDHALALGRGERRSPAMEPADPAEIKELGEAFSTMAEEVASRERALRESEALLRVTLTSIGDAVLTTNMEGRITFLNPVASALTGWGPEEALGRAIHSVFRIIDEKKREPAEDIVARVLREGRVVALSNHTALVARDGKEVPIEDSAAPIMDSSGRVVGVVLVFHDVTERRRAQETLRESEERFRKLFQSNPDAVVLASFDEGRYQEVNAACCRLLGCAREEIVGKTALELGIWADLDERATIREIISRAGRVSGFPSRIRDKSGDIRDVLISVESIELNGRMFMLSVVQDVTERKRIEALSQATHRIHDIIQSALDPEEIMQRALSCTAEAIGCETAAISLRDGDRWRVSYVHGLPEEAKGSLMEDEEEPHAVLAIETRRPVCVNDAFNDERVNCEHMKRWGIRAVLVTPLVTEDSVIGVVFFNHHGLGGSFDDAQVDFAGKVAPSISLAIQRARLFESVRCELVQRKQAEEALKRAHDELELRVQERTAELVSANETLREQAALLDLAHDAIMVRNMENRIVYWSKGAEETYGWIRDEATGRATEDLLCTQFPKPLEEILAELLQSGHWEGELRHRTRSGRAIITDSRWAVQKDSGGNPSGFLQINRDITERKRMEEAVQVYMKKLEQSNQALQDFSSIASHDLQEPLRKVSSFGSLLAAHYGEVLGEDGKDYLDRMLGATSRMQSLLHSLLEYSRVTTKTGPLRDVDLGEIVREALSDLEVRIDQVGGEVHVAALPVVEADPTQMRQLFQNLIGNALKFHTPDEQPVIRVLCGPEGSEEVQIRVEDNGIGFDEKHIHRIFSPFERLHGKSEYPGTGMGLAICKKIVERHGGSITAKSSSGKGSIFSITLPLKQPPGLS